VLSDARESVNRSRKFKKGVIMEIFSEIVVFVVRKGSYTTFNISRERENLGKERENPKKLVND